jgi:hypothetical protein
MGRCGGTYVARFIVVYKLVKIASLIDMYRGISVKRLMEIYGGVYKPPAIWWFLDPVLYTGMYMDSLLEVCEGVSITSLGRGMLGSVLPALWECIESSI